MYTVITVILNANGFAIGSVVGLTWSQCTQRNSLFVIERHCDIRAPNYLSGVSYFNDLLLIYVISVKIIAGILETGGN